MTTETRKGVIAFSITDRGALYSSYMSFVNNGGVFFDDGDNGAVRSNIENHLAATLQSERPTQTM